MTNPPSAWTGLLPVEDTALYVRDTGGNGRPVIYLNGAYADQSHWRRVIAELGDGYRHITFDERARGKSKRSADYSFEAALRDIDAVLRAREVERPLVVGWSYGAILSWYWADRHPDRLLGAVCVDAFPIGLTGEASRARIRKLFRRMRLLLPLAARFGLAARMSADRHADVNIEINEICAAERTGHRAADLPGAVRAGHRSEPGQRGRRDGAGTGNAGSDRRAQPEPEGEREGRQQPQQDPAQRLRRGRRSHPRTRPGRRSRRQLSRVPERTVHKGQPALCRSGSMSRATRSCSRE